MPAGSRVRANNVYGTISDNPLLSTSVSFSSQGLSLLPAIDVGQHAVIVIDPKRTVVGFHPEIAVVTAHLAMGFTATIIRGQYGTTAREWPAGTPWAHVPVDEDYIKIVTAATRPTNPYEGQLIYQTDTDTHLFYNGTAWTLIGSSPRIGWHIRKVANQAVVADSLTTISYDTEVQDTPDNFVAPGTTLTIPANADGLWAITFQTNADAAVSMQYARASIVAGGMTFTTIDQDDIGAYTPQQVVTIVVPLVAGNTIITQVQHSSTVTHNYVARLTAYRIGN